MEIFYRVVDSIIFGISFSALINGSQIDYLSFENVFKLFLDYFQDYFIQLSHSEIVRFILIFIILYFLINPKKFLSKYFELNLSKKIIINLSLSYIIIQILALIERTSLSNLYDKFYLFSSLGVFIYLSLSSYILKLNIPPPAKILLIIFIGKIGLYAWVILCFLVGVCEITW